MKVLKPHWVSHDDLPIYSIDIHPDGSRFATGGQGEDSGRVVIWNMAPVADQVVELDQSVPKMLCQLNNHLACVNCVRWSYSGKYLASGGDDKMIMVWVISKSGGGSVFGSKGAVNVESWRCVSTLKRHDGDVLDIAWSPHDVWLATCSVDNTVIVWDAHKLPEVVAVLKGHTGLVKGVTWDPVGKYLSTQSDDKSLRIWRTVDWQEEAVINKPFQECAGTTLVLRLSWSPDGQYLVSAHAMNGSGPTAQIIERDGWRHDIDFVGHRKAVTCVRFNSNILQRDFSRTGKTQHACCCAIGSRDKAISVWVTALKRPLVAMQNLFSRPVLDLSWSTSGLQLMACSLDGTVAYFEFTEEELGRPLTVEEKNALYEKTYGKSFASSQPTSAGLLENPSLVMSKKSVPESQVAVAKVATTPAPAPAPAPMAEPILPPVPVNKKQIETRTSDGKRRITPVFIPPVKDSGEGPAPFMAEEIRSSSSQATHSRIETVRRDEIVAPNVSTPVEVQEQPKRQRLIEDAPSVQKPVAPFKRNLDKTLTAISKRPAKLAGAGTAASGAVCQAAPAAGESLTLPCPQLRPITRYFIPGSSKCLLIENESCLSPFGRLTQVKLKMAERLLWETVLGSVVCVYAANPTLVVLGCADGTAHVYDTVSGARVIPAVMLGAAPVHVALSGAKLLCISGAGLMSVWCMQKRTSLVSDVSVRPIMSGAGRINRCSVTQAGVPTVVLDSGRAFMYSLEFKTWMRMADNKDAAVLNTQKSFQSAWQSLPDNGTVPLRTAQSYCHNSLERSLMHRQDNTGVCTQGYLEEQLVICRALASATEYRFWLTTYVRFLLQDGLESRLRLICETLMREACESDPNCLWNPTPLGIDRMTLLREVLNEMASSPQAQRLYTEFNEQLQSSIT
ncbi:protein HIRA homolog [Macrosteles quadrilineatus]|uniref:protein HIRA homolog n=1 Tax=Macrosteles quadrilineatus TaxID=74068 RepID=UPI0023E225F0|nr:protein HIRA homolog [Macrosteles quadrilineatus]